MMHISPLLPLLFAGAAVAQSVLPPFDNTWQIVNLGPVAGIGSYGGTAISPSSPNQLLVAPWPSTTIYSVPLVRNAQGAITGTGAAVPAIAVGGTDGGLAFGPGGVLFSTWFGPNRLNQIRPGSVTTDRVDDLAPLGVLNTVGACTFVPAGMPGAGRLKVCSWVAAEFHDVPLVPDGNGTYAPGTAGSPIYLANDVEGLVYAPPSTPMIGGRLLVCEYSQGNIVAYQIDPNGDPVPATRQQVVGGAAYLGGGTPDPVTGDFVFLQGNGHLLILRASPACGTCTNYGAASPGALGTPTIAGSGCARIGQTIILQFGGVTNGLGLLAAGGYQLNVPWQNLIVLQSVDVTLGVFLGPTASATLPLSIPLTPQLGWSHLYLQLALLDPSTQSGFSASNGLDMLIR